MTLKAWEIILVKWHIQVLNLLKVELKISEKVYKKQEVFILIYFLQGKKVLYNVQNAIKILTKPHIIQEIQIIVNVMLAERECLLDKIIITVKIVLNGVSVNHALKKESYLMVVIQRNVENVDGFSGDDSGWVRNTERTRSAGGGWKP